MQTLIGVYEDLETAVAAVEALQQEGIDPNHITLITSNRDPERTDRLAEEQLVNVQVSDKEQSAAEGAVKGGVLGGLTGLATGLIAVAIPGIGPVLALGPLAAAITGGAVGAASGSLLGALVESGVSDRDARLYMESVARDHTLVAVQAMEYQQRHVHEVLNRYLPVNVKEKSRLWDKVGWIDDGQHVPTPRTLELYTNDFTAFEPEFRTHWQESYGRPGTLPDDDVVDGTSDFFVYLPAYRYGYELALKPDLHTQDWSETETVARAQWEDEHDQPWDDVHQAIRHAWQRTRETNTGDEVRGVDEGIPFSDKRDPHYSHYNQYYEKTGIPFDRFEPAYRFGELLAKDVRYRDREWDDIKFPVSERWKHDHPADGDWREVEDAVRHAWKQALQDPDSIHYQDEVILDS